MLQVIDSTGWLLPARHAPTAIQILLDLPNGFIGRKKLYDGDLSLISKALSSRLCLAQLFAPGHNRMVRCTLGAPSLYSEYDDADRRRTLTLLTSLNQGS